MRFWGVIAMLVQVVLAVRPSKNMSIIISYMQFLSLGMIRESILQGKTNRNGPQGEHSSWKPFTNSPDTQNCKAMLVKAREVLTNLDDGPQGVCELKHPMFCSGKARFERQFPRTLEEAGFL